MADSAGSWKQFVFDFWHLRTHTTYGLLAAAASSGFMTIVSPTLDLRIASIISFAGSLGGLVDIVAHLFYH